MKVTSLYRALAVLGGVGLALAPVGVAAAQTPPAPSPSPGAATVTRAGTSFLTAAAVAPGQPVALSASTGDYLYWSFPAAAGQTHQVVATVELPPTRSGPSTWLVEVFDGLRRRQACTAGAQSPTAAATDGEVTLGCVLREVRTWAEPWSGDPLPGTYYIRLSVVDLPEPDLGLPVRVALLVGATDGDDPLPEGGELRAPLAPDAGTAAAPGGTVAPDGTATPGLAAGESDGAWGWLPDLPRFSARWVWTGAGGVLAAVGGVVGFALTWRPRRRAA